MDKENLGPLHKRCNVCHMIMLKKNISRHVRDQHTVGRPRSGRKLIDTRGQNHHTYDTPRSGGSGGEEKKIYYCYPNILNFLVCPICAKSYKTSDWLKDHIRRGHGYSKVGLEYG